MSFAGFAELAWRIERKYDGAPQTVPSLLRRALAIIVHAWYVPEGRWRYLRLTAAEFVLSWPLSAAGDLLVAGLTRDAGCDGLMFHNGYRLFEFDGERWVMQDGVFK